MLHPISCSPQSTHARGSRLDHLLILMHKEQKCAPDALVPLPKLAIATAGSLRLDLLVVLTNTPNKQLALLS